MSKVSLWVDEGVADGDYVRRLCLRVRAAHEHLDDRVPRDLTLSLEVAALERFLRRLEAKETQPPHVILGDAPGKDLVANVRFPHLMEVLIRDGSEETRSGIADGIRSIVRDRVVQIVQSLLEDGALREGTVVSFGGKTWRA